MERRYYRDDILLPAHIESMKERIDFAGWSGPGTMESLLAEREALWSLLDMVKPMTTKRFLPQRVQLIETSCVYCTLLTIETEDIPTALIQHDSDCIYVLIAQAAERSGRSSDIGGQV